MSNQREEQPAQFVVICLNEENRIDAAAMFSAKTVDAYTEGQLRAVHAGAMKFQILKVIASTNGSLEFIPMRKSL
jgi:hypothetical protein